MKNAKFWLISVFTDRNVDVLGNVAAVVLLEYQIEDKQMQRIANDLNQPATTFLWQEDTKWNIRWFAPDAEIQLCGHGAMAAASLFDFLDEEIPTFIYKKGELSGFKKSDNIYIRLTRGSFTKTAVPKGLEKGLGVKVIQHFETSDKNIVLLESEKHLREMRPNFDALQKLKPFGYAVTTRGKDVDFVSRTLVPKVQQLEDHATGSSHTVLVPLWSELLNKKELLAQQLSRRGGKFDCRLDGDKVVLGGKYAVLASGELLE